MSSAQNKLRKSAEAAKIRKAETVSKSLEEWAAENARRKKCRHCELMILDMERHVQICHG